MTKNKSKNYIVRDFFLNEHDVGGSNFWDVLNMMSHEVLEGHVGYCNHSST